MNTVKIAAIMLMLASVLGLAYGSFSYTKETHETKIGPIELSVKDKQTVNVPVWAGVGAIVIGGVLFVFGSKKSYPLHRWRFNRLNSDSYTGSCGAAVFNRTFQERPKRQSITKGEAL